MIATEFDTLLENPDYVTVLEAYRDALESLPEEQSLVARFVEVPGVRSEVLSAIHGQLIALDLLEIEIPDRHTGLMYLLTAFGKQMLRRLEAYQKEQLENISESEGLSQAA